MFIDALNNEIAENPYAVRHPCAGIDEMDRNGIRNEGGQEFDHLPGAQFCLEQPGCTTLQIIFNLRRQDAATALFPKAAERDVGINVRLPLASGLLSGKFDKTTRFEPTDHRNFNANGEKFSVGETFSGITF